MLPHDVQGSGPAVVLLHAGIADRRMWAGMVPELVDHGYRVVALDLPGFGDDALPPSGPQAPWNDVLATLDTLQIDTAALIGCSYGGAVALRVAALHRGRFWGLVLSAAPAPGLEPSRELANRWAAEERALDAGDFDGATGAVVDAWTLPSAPESVRQLVGAAQRRAYELQHAATDVTDVADPLNDDADRLTGIEVPTLVIEGDLDLVDFREGGKLLARLLPDASLHTITGAGHLAPLEQPAAFSAGVLPFLAAHRPGEGRPVG